MLIDNFASFGTAKSAVVNSGATAIIGDEIDLKTGRDIGTGTQLYMLLQVSTDFVGVGASAEFKLESDSENPIVPASATEHWTSGAIAITNLVVGWRRIVPLPVGQNYERYLGLTVTGSGANITAGAVDAFITYGQPPSWKAYAEGIS